jgi:hypothetical protein
MDGTVLTPGARPGCQWCSAPATADATHCAACGAALAQRESVGGLVIPGVTDVDPGLSAYGAEYLRIPGPSPSQSLAGPAMGAMVVAGPAGAALALGGLATVAATEFLGASRSTVSRAALDALGQPSEAAQAMARQLDASAIDGPGSTGPTAESGPARDGDHAV